MLFVVCFVFEHFVKASAVNPFATHLTLYKMFSFFELRFFVCFVAHIG
jgi:hypothetical protein